MAEHSRGLLVVAAVVITILWVMGEGWANRRKMARMVGLYRVIRISKHEKVVEIVPVGEDRKPFRYYLPEFERKPNGVPQFLEMRDGDLVWHKEMPT